MVWRTYANTLGITFTLDGQSGYQPFFDRYNNPFGFPVNVSVFDQFSNSVGYAYGNPAVQTFNGGYYTCMSMVINLRQVSTALFWPPFPTHTVRPPCALTPHRSR